MVEKLRGEGGAVEWRWGEMTEGSEGEKRVGYAVYGVAGIRVSCPGGVRV